MAALREILIAFGVSVDTAPIDAANKKTDSLIQKLEKFGKALAGIYVIKRIVGEAFSLAEEATALEHMSQATGLSTHELQAWQLGAKEAGVEGEGFNVALRKLSKELAGGTAKNQSKILHEYGLTALKTAGHAITLTEALPAIAEKFKAMADGPAKSGAATELFGRQGARLIPLLNQGAAGIVKLKKELDELGGGFSPEFIKQSVEVEKQTKRLDVSWTSLKVRIFGLLLPALLAGVNGFIKVSAWLSDLSDRTHLFGSALAVLGTLAAAVGASIVVAFWPVLAPLLAWAAAIAAVILIAEDLYGFFTGKNSLIGEAIDAAFGEGSQAKVREWFQAVYAFAKEVFGAIGDIFGDTTKTFGERLDNFLDYLGGAFASHFTGTFSEICQDIIAIFKVAIDGIEAAIGGLVKAAKAAAKLLGIGGDDAPEDGGAPGTPLPPPTDADIQDAFGGQGRRVGNTGPKKWFPEITKAAVAASNQSVPTPALPSTWGESPYAPIQPPVVNNYVTVPPGTTAQQARAVAAAAEHGTKRGLAAPNRAASNAVGRAAK